jgi:hypothetical protein
VCERDHLILEARPATAKCLDALENGRLPLTRELMVAAAAACGGSGAGLLEVLGHGTSFVSRRPWISAQRARATASWVSWIRWTLSE